MEHTIITERTVEHRPEARTAAVNALAVVGFLALVFIGIVLAIYAARYIPEAVSSLFTVSNDNLTIVPTMTFPAATTTPATVATTTAPMFTHSATTTATTTKPATKPAAPVVGYTTVTTTYPTPGSTQVPVPVTYSGLPNLTVSIQAVGYIDTNGVFVSQRNSDNNNDFAAKILVTNNGTNKTGTWEIETIMPTEHDSTFEHTENMVSLEPGATLPLTLRLTRGTLRASDNDQLQVTVDSGNDVVESNENDNEATAIFSGH